MAEEITRSFMATETTPAFDIYKLQAWYLKNRKQVIWVATGIAAIVLVGSFTAWKRGEAETTASEAVSNVSLPMAAGGSSMGAATAEAYLRVAAQYPDSKAATRAILLAAGTYYSEGQFEQARLTFEKFTRAHRDSPLMGEALLGIASCYDALGRTNEAVNAYKDLVDRHPNENVAPQARFALARLYETQNMIEQARTLYEDVAKTDPNSSLGSEAGIRLEELKILYPPPAPPPSTTVPPTITPIVTPETPAATTPAPTPGLLISNLPPPPPASTGAAPATPKP